VAAPARAPTPPPTAAPIPAPRPPPAIAPITAPVPAPTRPPPNARSAGLYGSARAVVANINPAPIRQPIVASLLICPTPNLQREQTTMVCSSSLVRWAGRTKPAVISRRSWTSQTSQRRSSRLPMRLRSGPCSSSCARSGLSRSCANPRPLHGGRGRHNQVAVERVERGNEIGAYRPHHNDCPEQTVFDPGDTIVILISRMIGLVRGLRVADRP
jgi:hypothetical protein